MKLAIVGTHHVTQTLTINEEELKNDNRVSKYELIHDDTLINLALQAKENHHDVSLFANFNVAPLSIAALHKVEKKGIQVFPDLQDNNHQKLIIKTLNDTFVFNDGAPLRLTKDHMEVFSNSSYIITNIDDFGLLSTIANRSDAKIIVLNTFPMYRALSFVEGLVLSTPPINEKETVESLINSGLSWIAIQDGNTIRFRTLKNLFELSIDSIDDFVSQFLNAMESNDLVNWLNSNKI